MKTAFAGDLMKTFEQLSCVVSVSNVVPVSRRAVCENGAKREERGARGERGGAVIGPLMELVWPVTTLVRPMKAVVRPVKKVVPWYRWCGLVVWPVWLPS